MQILEATQLLISAPRMGRRVVVEQAGYSKVMSKQDSLMTVTRTPQALCEAPSMHLSLILAMTK